MLVGFRLSHRTNVNFKNPYGWSPQFGGDWWGLLERILRDYPDADGIYLRGANGSDFRGYRSEPHPYSVAFESAYRLLTGKDIFIDYPYVPYKLGMDIPEAGFILIEGHHTLAQVEKALSVLPLDRVILPEKYIKKDAESLADWSQPITFFNITGPRDIEEENRQEGMQS